MVACSSIPGYPGSSSAESAESSAFPEGLGFVVRVAPLRAAACEGGGDETKTSCGSTDVATYWC